MSLDATAIAALIAAVAAIIAPVITTSLTARHEYKMKRIELFYAPKLAAYEQFLKVASRYPSNPTSEDIKNLNETYHLAALHSSFETTQKLALYFKYLKPGKIQDWDVYDDAYLKAITAMSNELATFQNKPWTASKNRSLFRWFAKDR